MSEHPSSENKKSKISFDGIVDKLVCGDLGGTSDRLTDAEKNFLREHPLLLNKINNISFIKKRYIAYLASFSLIWMVIAKTVEYSKIFSDWPVLDDLLGNVAFAIATEVFGATLMAYIMELLLEKRMLKNRYLLEELKQTEK